MSNAHSISERPKVLLVDGPSILVTLFYAMGGKAQLETDDETAITKFSRQVIDETIARIKQRVELGSYSAVRVALESPDHTPIFRYTLYPDYKRAISGIGKIHVARALQDVFAVECANHALNPIYSPGLEADDVIATMVHLLNVPEYETHIWSRDKDLHQLLTHENIKIVGKEGHLITKTEAENIWGAPVTALPLIRALMGDTSDNIKGITGIGQKSASKYIKYAPHAKPNPWILDYDAMPTDIRKAVQVAAHRLALDQYLCTLKIGNELETDIQKYLTGELHGQKN